MQTIGPDRAVVGQEVGSELWPWGACRVPRAQWEACAAPNTSRAGRRAVREPACASGFCISDRGRVARGCFRPSGHRVKRLLAALWDAVRARQQGECCAGGWRRLWCWGSQGEALFSGERSVGRVRAPSGSDVLWGDRCGAPRARGRGCPGRAAPA